MTANFSSSSSCAARYSLDAGASWLTLPRLGRRVTIILPPDQPPDDVRVEGAGGGDLSWRVEHSPDDIPAWPGVRTKLRLVVEWEPQPEPEGDAT